MFPFWTQQMLIFDLKFGFLVKNCIYIIIIYIAQNLVKNDQTYFLNLFFINHIMGLVWDPSTNLIDTPDIRSHVIIKNR